MLHIFTAIASVLLVTYLLFKPSRAGLVAEYILIGATLGSGVALVILEPAKMMHVCMAGAAYLAVMLVMQAAVRRQLHYARSSETTL